MSTTTIVVSLNGTRTEVVVPATVGTLIDGLGKGRKGVAVARNDDVVPRSAWDHESLCDGDVIEVLTVAQGG